MQHQLKILCILLYTRKILFLYIIRLQQESFTQHTTPALPPNIVLPALRYGFLSGHTNKTLKEHDAENRTISKA